MKTIALVAASLLIATAAFAQAPLRSAAPAAAAAAPATGPADTAGASCQSTIGPKKSARRGARQHDKEMLHRCGDCRKTARRRGDQLRQEVHVGRHRLSVEI